MPTLLIADDSIFQRLILGKVAKAEGYVVLEAKNGQECLDVLRTDTPDMALLDLHMPVLSGMEVLAAVKAEALPTGIIVITADIQNTTRQQCLDLGARALLSKPPQEDVLRATLRQVLTGS